jgi:hypothetical protein
MQKVLAKGPVLKILTINQEGDLKIGFIEENSYISKKSCSKVQRER